MYENILPQPQRPRKTSPLAVLLVFVVGTVGGIAWLQWSGSDPLQAWSEFSEPPREGEANTALPAAEAPAATDEETGELARLKKRIAELEVRSRSRTADQHAHRVAAKAAGQQAGQQQPAQSSFAAANPQQPQSSGAQTLTFWNNMNRIIVREAIARHTPSNVTAGNALSFMRNRQRAAKHASEQLRRLDRQGVDPELLHLAGELAAWYDRGAQLGDEATYLLTKADPGERRGTPGQAWRAGEEEQRRSVEAINRHGQALQGTLSQRYGMNFPPFQ